MSRKGGGRNKRTCGRDTRRHQGWRKRKMSGAFCINRQRNACCTPRPNKDVEDLQYPYVISRSLLVAEPALRYSLSTDMPKPVYAQTNEEGNTRFGNGNGLRPYQAATD